MNEPTTTPPARTAARAALRPATPIGPVSKATASATAATAAATATPAWLGPATVLRTDRQHAVVRRGDGLDDEVTATLVLPVPFEPAPGDVLLLLSQGGTHAAVGVLHGARPRALEFAGDVSIRAVGGSLSLHSDTSIRIEAPKVVVRASVVRTIARTLVERSERLLRWVRGLSALRAGASRRTVDGTDTTHCHDSTTLAKGTVRIDGDQLHLGH